ncbi:hypothetical protein CEXT_749411 [Caerostris extrusa]|uniref:Uncharacterized protein n=1 Tax=Caerostris extrusa TaxID=172846 RepID=A0AAV4X715_CAEEX|nr:hypothetical protein CEXT_749411 [Caerostris extrusa]
MGGGMLPRRLDPAVIDKAFKRLDVLCPLGTLRSPPLLSLDHFSRLAADTLGNDPREVKSFKAAHLLPSPPFIPEPSQSLNSNAVVKSMVKWKQKLWREKQKNQLKGCEGPR